jgi:PKD-like domain
MKTFIIFLIAKAQQLMLKTTLLFGLFFGISLPIFSQQKEGEAAREEPKTLKAETFNFLELARKQEAGLLPPPPVKDPKPPKHLGIQGNNPLPLGFEKAIEAPTPPLLNIPSPNPDLTFLGLNQGSSGLNPADVGGAVGPNHVMTALNSEVCIRDKSGTLISKVTLANFVGTTNFAFDPKVVYDPYSQRWIFSACSTANPVSILEMKVSATNDPTGNWYTYHLNVDATGLQWFDYPSMGFNKDWIVVSGNMFTWGTTGTFQGAKTYIFKKSDMYAGASASTYIMTHPSVYTLVPATTYDNTLSKVYLMAEWNTANGALGLYEISGVPPAAPTYSASPILMPTAQAWSQTAVNARQLGSTELISTGISRILTLFYRNGSLWTTQPAYLPATSPTRSAVQWWQINPTSTSNTGCVTQFGRIDDPTGNIFCAFPALAVNADNTVMISYAVFSPNIYPSTSYHVRYSSDPSGTMRDGVTFRNGTAKYNDGDPTPGAASRWGDYSVATVDPVNDKDFWTQQVVSATPVSGTDKWETYWAKLIMCPVAPQPSGFSTFSANVCKGANNMYYSIPSVSGATSYTWTYSGTGASFSSTTTTPNVSINFSLTATNGTLSVVANNACGASSARSGSISVIDIPSTVSVSGGGNVCNSTTITASGGTGGTMYFQGTNSNGTSFATQSSSQTITTSGTYYFRAYNSCGWSTQGSTTVTFGSIPTAVTVSGGGTSCTSRSISASGGSSGNIYFQGTNNNGFSLATQSSSQTVTASGTYYFRAYNGCWGPSTGVTVTIIPDASPVTVSGGGTVCNSATLTATGGVGGTIYWQGTTVGGTSNTTESMSQVVTVSGTYYFRVRSTTCGWGPQGSATVNIVPEASPVTVSGGGTFCNSATLTATGGAGGTIYWQGTTVGGTSNTTASMSQVVTASGTYYFRVRSTTCGWGPQGSATVTINSSPSAVTVSGGGNICGTSTILNATGGGGSTIYWQGTNSSGTLTTTPASSQTVYSSGTYYFRAFNGCWGPIGNTTVTMNAAPTALSVTGGGIVCNSATITASGGVGGTVYFQGMNPNGNTFGSTALNQVVTGTGEYFFRTYNAACGWGPAASTIVVVFTPTSPVNVSGGGITCAASSNLVATGGSGGTIYWQGVNATGTSSATPSNNQVVSASGTYFFRAYNSGCGWGAPSSASVTIIPNSLLLSGSATNGTQIASQTITSRQNIPIGINVTYQAPQSITLEATPTQGIFIANKGSVFKAEIKNCAN